MNLLDFLERLQGLLREIVEERSSEFIPEYLHGELREAWSEVDAAFGEVRELIASGELDSELRARGLAGSQFEFKAKGFRRALWWFRNRDGAPRILRKVLNWADVALDSLAKLIPGAEAIKEFKDAVTASVEDQDDGTAEGFAQAPDE